MLTLLRRALARTRTPVFVVTSALLAVGVPHLLAGTADGTALVRHGPNLNGTVDGSIHQMLPESVTLNGGAIVTGDLLVPGLPTVRLNGKPTFLGTFDFVGAATPSNHQITLNGGASLGHVVRRVDPVPLTTVAAPALPAGTRSVTVNQSGQAVAPWSTLRNLTLNGGVGDVAVPPGTYGDFTANSGTSFTLGVAGATQASAYTFQRIKLNGQAQIHVVGPVVLTVAYGFSWNGTIGVSAHPEWLTLNVYSGGITLNGGGRVYGFVNAPAGTVIINGNSQLLGGVSCDRLTVNGGGLLRLVSPISENLPPVAQPGTFSLDEDASVEAALAGSDPESAPVTFVIATRPGHGSLHSSSGPITEYPTPPLTVSGVRYVPQPDYAGSDSFTFHVSDGELESPPATISLLVRPVNDAPVAFADPVTLPEDAPEGAAITLRAFDIDSPLISVSVVDGPQHGILLPGAGEAVRIYRPDPNFFGSDAFTFLAHDGSLHSELVTIAITVTPVNDPPMAFAQSLVTREETDLDFVITGFDVDGDALTFTRLNEPFGGIVSGDGAGLRYHPLVNFAGLDWFEFKVSDGQTESAPATISIEVTNENDAPGADSLAVSTQEDATAAVTLTGADADGDPIWFSIVRQPEHAQGDLVVRGSTVTYRPIGDYFGPDSFTYKSTDIFAADSPEATVTIMVEPINDAPMAHGQSVSTEEDRPVDVTLTGSDTEDPSVSFEIVQPPAKGDMTGGTGPGVFQFVPHPNQNGSDQFTFVVRDSEGLASEAMVVRISIQPVNDAPVALPRTLEVVEDGELPFEFTSTDEEGDPVTYEIAAPPQFGTITSEAATDAAHVYTPAANYHGPDSLTYIARDADASEPVTVSIIVLPINDAPEASAPEVITDRNVAVPFTLVANDVDGDALVYDIVTGPGHGMLDTQAGPLGTFPHSDLHTPNLTYQPHLDFAGEDVLTFQARDPAGAASGIVTVPIIVRATNRPPIARDSIAVTSEDVPTTLSLDAGDPDGDALTYILVTLPAYGTLTGEGASRTYTPAAEYSGADAFTFKVSDGTVESGTATVSISVVAFDDPPVADSKSVETDEDTPVQLTLTGTDPEGAELSYAIQSQPLHGTLSGGGALRTYTPSADYAGPDTFTYTVTADGVASEPATVDIMVRPRTSGSAVVLSLPDGRVAFSAGESISLQSLFDDSGDPIESIEYFDGEEKIGELLHGDTILSWTPASRGTYRLWVRVRTQAGRVIDALEVQIVVGSAIPAAADFEPAEGYSFGALNGQCGWSASEFVTIGATRVFNGTAAIQIPPSDPANTFGQTFVAPVGENLVFLDFSVMPVASVEDDQGVVFSLNGAKVAFVLFWDGDGLFRISTQSGVWRDAEYISTVWLDGTTKRSRRFVECTVRLDFANRRWDLAVEGTVVASDLPFASEAVEGVVDLNVYGHRLVASAFDFFAVGSVNFAFADRDRDNMDDYWEQWNFTDGDRDDRTGDPDGDGLPNIKEYVLGADPNNLDSDGDGMPDGWEFDHGLDPARASDASEDPDDDGAPNLMEYQNGGDPRIPMDVTDGDQLDDNWERNHFGTLTAGEQDDPDEDGLVNLDEHQRLTNPVLPDTDRDGLEDGEELAVGRNPTDYYDGRIPTIEVVTGNLQVVKTGERAPHPFVVRLLDADGNIMPYAPVTFATVDGTSRLVTNQGTEAVATVSVLASNTGEASAADKFVFAIAPVELGARLEVVVTAGGASMVLACDSTADEPNDPPLDFRVTDNGDGTITVSWFGPPGRAEGIVFRKQNEDGTWVQFAEVSKEQIPPPDADGRFTVKLQKP